MPTGLPESSLPRKDDDGGGEAEESLQVLRRTYDVPRYDEGQFEERSNDDLLDPRDEYGNTAELTTEFTLAAFTVAELGEMLPDEVEINAQAHWLNVGRSLNNEWDIADRKNGTASRSFVCEAAKEADARDKMLIYLLESGLVKSRHSATD